MLKGLIIMPCIPLLKGDSIPGNVNLRSGFWNRNAKGCWSKPTLGTGNRACCSCGPADDTDDDDVDGAGGVDGGTDGGTSSTGVLESI